MKKIFLFLIALVATYFVPINSLAAHDIVGEPLGTSITFVVTYVGGQVTSFSTTPRIYVYKGGEQLNSDTYMNSGIRQIELDDSYIGQTIAYRSSLGHEGKVTVTRGMVINLNCNKLTVTTKDSEGNPLTWQEVYIYDANGRELDRVSTNNDGTATGYYAVADEYTYGWYNTSQRGDFTLNSDYTLNLVRGGGGSEPVVSTYTMKIVPRCGDFPVNPGGESYSSINIYKYGEKSNPVASYNPSGYSSYPKVPAGDYWIRDVMGVFSKKIEVTEDMTAYLDYQKITFVSKTGSTPNAYQTISVRVNSGDSYSSKSVTTNNKGKAIIYLLPGEYVYTVTGSSTNFTVLEEDQTVNINTAKVTISLNCDDISALYNQTFEWGTISSSSSYNYSEVHPTDGKIVVNAMPGIYKLRINRVSEIDVNVTTGENNVPVQLYYVIFTTNLSTPSSVYIGNNGQAFGFDAKYYLAPGTYSYGTTAYSSNQTPFTLNANKTIALNYATLTVNVKDTKGNAVADQNVYINPGGNTWTDSNGQSSGTLLYGSYTVYASGYEDLGQTVELTGDKSVTITIPAPVTFSVLENGQPMSGSGYAIVLYPEKSRYNGISVYVNNGAASARVEPGKAYTITNYHGSAVITEGCTLSLGTLSISCEGMGLAFPMENWDAVSTYPVIVGSTVRLTAIPVTDDKFQHWTINGNDYNSPVIDLKLTQPNTTAKAVFGGTITSAAKAFLSGLTFDIDDNYIYLGDDKEGTAKIYTSDGKLVKSIGVIGGQIGIYDLSTGVYILSFQDESGVKSTRFSKK